MNDAMRELDRSALRSFSKREENRLRVERRLLNWRRWMDWGAGGGGGRGCGSAERRYRAPKLTQEESESRASAALAVAVDVTDAILVAAALKQIKPAWSEFLRDLYYRDRPEEEVCRRFNIHPALLWEKRLHGLLVLSRMLMDLEISASRQARGWWEEGY